MSFRGIPIKAIGEIKVLGKAEPKTKGKKKSKKEIVGEENTPLPSKMLEYKIFCYQTFLHSRKFKFIAFL